MCMDVHLERTPNYLGHTDGPSLVGALEGVRNHQTILVQSPESAVADNNRQGKDSLGMQR